MFESRAAVALPQQWHIKLLGRVSAQHGKTAPALYGCHNPRVFSRLTQKDSSPHFHVFKNQKSASPKMAQSTLMNMTTICGSQRSKYFDHLWSTIEVFVNRQSAINWWINSPNKQKVIEVLGSFFLPSLGWVKLWNPHLSWSPRFLS